jgi:cell division septation protein DedD
MSTTHDDSFREIQLSGKQVVFFFMAAVVLVVVVFLMGVQVGRGVLSQRGLPEGADSSADAGDVEPPPAPAAATPGSSAPVTANEKLSYAERLGGSEPAAEQLKNAEQLKKQEDAPPPTPKPEAAPPVARPAPTTSAAAAPTEPAGSGFSIQVAALRERGEADTIVKRLASKGYPAYVVAPAKGSASIFRVRVGKYKDRREADTVAAKLQKEEQFKPWVVR